MIDYNIIRRYIFTTFLILAEFFIMIIFWNILFPYDKVHTYNDTVLHVSFGSYHIFFNFTIIIISILTGLIGYNSDINIKNLFYGQNTKRKIN